jgi:hypothetical protein
MGSKRQTMNLVQDGQPLINEIKPGPQLSMSSQIGANI